MNLFINDIPVRVLKLNEAPDAHTINTVLDSRTDIISKSHLINHLHITHATILDMEMIFNQLNSKVPISLLSLHVSIDNYQEFLIWIKKTFKVIKAAGGLARKKDKFLMIY